MNKFTRDPKRNREKKNIIFDVVSEAPVIEFQAELAMLGAAKNRKNVGLNIRGRELPPDKR